jgi:O-antigen ligase
VSTAPVPADGARASAGPRRSVRALAERGGLALTGLTLAALEGVLLAADARLGVAVLAGVVYAPLALVSLTLAVAGAVVLLSVEHLTVVWVAPTASMCLCALCWLGSRRDAATPAIPRELRAPLTLTAALATWASLSALWARSADHVVDVAWTWWVAVATLVVVCAAMSSPRAARIILLAFVAGATLAVLAGLAGLGGAQGARVDGRLAGGGGDPNVLAAGLVPAAVLAAALRRRPSPTGVRLALLVAMATLVTGLLLTESRGGALAGAACVVAAFVLFRGRRWRVAGLAAALVIGLVLALAASPSGLGRLTHFGDEGSGRTELWRVALHEAADHPFTGVGLGNFADESQRYTLSVGTLRFANEIVDKRNVVHNSYLEVLAETGIPGLVLFLAIVATCLHATWVAARRFAVAGRADLSTLSEAVLVAQIGILSTAALLSLETDDRLWILLALGPGLAALAGRRP